MRRRIVRSTFSPRLHDGRFQWSLPDVVLARPPTVDLLVTQSRCKSTASLRVTATTARLFSVLASPPAYGRASAAARDCVKTRGTIVN